MKTSFKIAALLLVALQLTACATVQKKFTRKPKEQAYTPKSLYFEEGPYQKKFSNDYYYKTHFTMWRSWHSELLDQLGGNSKKVTRCAQEAVSHLHEMRRYLQPDLQAQLDPVIADLAKVQAKLERGVADSEIGPVRVELERLQRAVNSGFYFDKIKPGLLPDNVDLGESSA